MELRSEIGIDAAPAAVWEVLTEVDRYHEWNPFVTSLAGDLKKGGELKVVMSPPDQGDFRYRGTVVTCDDSRELRWQGKIGAAFLLRGTHFWTLEAREDGGTRLKHGLDAEGMLTGYVARQLTAAARGMVFMNQALKRRVEARKRALGSG